MGKTLPPFSQLIEGERRRWSPFKRALPKADQPLFDRLFDCAKLHIQAGVMVARPWPFETLVMAIVLEQQKQVERLQSLLDELESSRQV
jgi:3-methyladenine DNA glycosylase/8-oxoguanine DNA glycosylase